MDTPVLISHKTAWLVHHAPQHLAQAAAQRDYQIGAQGLSTQQRIARIRHALTDCGIPSDMLKTIDISVVFEFERVRANGVACHILGQNLPYDHIDELTPGIFITDETFTFVFAAEWMDKIEYLEYGYEVCGDYRMGLGPSDSYSEQPATTSKNQITELLDQHPGKPGATRARLALRHIYDHSASPMETASPFLSQQAKAELASEVSNSTNRSKSPSAFGIAPKPGHSKSMPSLATSVKSSGLNIRAVFTMRSTARERMRSERRCFPKWDTASSRSPQRSLAISLPFTAP